jgi:hypothetical protein
VATPWHRRWRAIVSSVIALTLLVVAVGAATNMPNAARSRRAGVRLAAIITTIGVPNVAVILTGGTNPVTAIATLATGLTLGFALHRWTTIRRVR